MLSALFLPLSGSFISGAVFANTAGRYTAYARTKLQVDLQDRDMTADEKKKHETFPETFHAFP
jgi:hypothetical protein